MTKISLYLDEHVQLALAESLRARGFMFLQHKKQEINVFLMLINLSLLKKINEPYFHTTRDTLQRFIISG